MELRTKRTAGWAATLAAFATTAAFAAAPASAAATTCDRVASPTGSDSAPGTEAQPLLTASKLVGSLQQGQTGCLRAGTYSANNEVKISVSGVTLTSYPGERALLQGRVYVPDGTNSVTVSDLDLDGRNSGDLPSPTIAGDGVVLRGNDITNHRTEICISVGSPTWGRAQNTVIENNKIHDCGELPATNMDHGIYVNSADDTLIRGNWIYDNADRGIQLYSDAQRTRVVGNVIDGNGQGVIFGGDGDSASSGNVVENNVITNSKIRHNVESNWTGPVGTGNVVRNNCIGGGFYGDVAGGILVGIPSKLGFTATDNLLQVPEFANRAAGDFTISPAHPCAGILAGGAAPPSGTVEPAPATSVTIKPSKKRVAAMAPVLLSGTASGADAVTILRRERGGWRRVGRAATKGKHSYRMRVRLRHSGTSRLKAVAAGLRDSQTVRVRIK